MKKIILISITLLSITPIYAQGIKGRVLDEKKEPLINATIQTYQNGILKGGVITDYDGNYNISPLDSGVYSVLVLYAGYDSSIISNIQVINDQATNVNFQLKRNKNAIICRFPIPVYKKPLIDQDNPTRQIYTRDEIDRIPH